ncbi:SIMPL domain-containing protein [Devosia sp.]|uniref:SIMPL domain-containing protein n=1 Tax=Devosia sp. TaxID=1871048 RepID=UPI001AD40D31|nr:SIMPL domain-containing protein [Devosia sp.]MBN9309355.1 SIMPL domain-containing protein [Devosia sp.]
MRPFTAAIIPFMLATALSAAPVLAQESPMNGTISISGLGEVTATPDTAFINSGVTTQGATAREALDANTKAMADLLDTLKAAGIEARDIQTSGFSVNPNYVYSDARDANGYQLPPKITGYQVFNNVSVRVRDLASLGGVLDKAVNVGANTINGISFSVADPSKLYDEARKEAFADAREKAELYAGAAGEKLGTIRNITESQGYTQPQPYMMKAAADAAPSAVPIASGELSFQINVQVTWDLAH